VTGSFSKAAQSFLLCVLTIFSCAEGVGARFIAGPVEVKLKEQEGEFLHKYDLAVAYKAKNWRWSLDTVFYDPMSYQRLSRVKNAVRIKTKGGWWVGGEGSYSFESACDYWRLRFLTEKRNTKSWSWKLWSDGEWRQTNTGYSLDEYAYSEYGLGVGWTPWKKFRLTGELTKRVKDYATSPNSWTKYNLVTEGRSRHKNHELTVSYKEASGVYPENAWGNYWSNSWGVDWSWKVAAFAGVRLDHTQHFQQWGNGKQRRERDFLAVLECPKGNTFTVDWMFGVQKSVGQLILVDEVREDDADFRSRMGLRFTTEFPARHGLKKHRVRAELFRKLREDGEECGGMLNIILNYPNLRWELGLAPWGGFNYSAEKGYWIKATYYFH